ncbi:MAG: hypothetical protein LBV75_03275 [Paludibacter sp.]|jgi:hypothetical protein|nr:hypothetical protein [Paludibacter sp.]
MKKSKKIPIIVISVLLIAYACIYVINLIISENSSVENAMPGEVKNIKYVLFTRSDYANFDFYNDSTLKRNVALLITDKDEMIDDQKLFLAPTTISHLCGYSYKISFWYDFDSIYSSRSLNGNCESFDYKPYKTQKQLDFYAKRLETRPTHYIYNLSIPVSIKPDEVKEKLRNSGLKIFFLDGKNKRYPGVNISYETKSFVEKNKRHSREAEDKNAQKFRKEIEEIVNNVNVIVPFLNKSGVRFYNIGTIGDSTYHKGTIYLTFELGIDSLKVKNILEQAGAKSRFSIPKTYNIQLLDTSPDIDDIRNKLKKYTFIEQISEYGSEW